MLTTDSKSKGLKLIILSSTVVLVLIFLTIEAKLVYDSYTEKFSKGTTQDLIDQKSLDKIINKLK